MIRSMWAIAAAAAIAVAGASKARADDDGKKETTRANTVAVFRFDGEMCEKPKAEGFSFTGKTPDNLKETIEHLRKAATDSQVKAVVILVEGATIGTAQKEELR